MKQTPNRRQNVEFFNKDKKEMLCNKLAQYLDEFYIIENNESNQEILEICKCAKLIQLFNFLNTEFFYNDSHFWLDKRLLLTIYYKTVEIKFSLEHNKSDYVLSKALLRILSNTVLLIQPHLKNVHYTN
jgi:hypothetical protein